MSRAPCAVPHVMNVEVESRAPMFSSGVKQGLEFELAREIEDPDRLDDNWLEVE